MERIVNLHIERLPEGVYLATSGDVQGLVAQGRTIQETRRSRATWPRSSWKRKAKTAPI